MSIGTDWVKAFLKLGSRVPTRDGAGPGLGFRKPISLPWQVGIGAFSVLTIVVVYTWASWSLQRSDPEKGLLLPSWEQLWTKGVLQNLTPVEVGVRPASGKEEEERAARKEAADAKLRAHLILDDEPRLKEEEARLKALAERPLKDAVLADEALRKTLLPNMPLDQRDQADDDFAAVLKTLPSADQALVTEALGKVDEHSKKTAEADRKAEEARKIYSLMLWEDVRATFWRLFVGMAVTVLVSVVLGVAMGCYAPVEAFLYPPLSVLAKIPGTAMLSLFLAISALSEFRFSLYMILFGMIPTLTQTVYGYTKEVPEELLFKARTLGASQIECIWSVIYQSIRPKILEMVRLALGPALIFLYAAELTFGDVGLGCRMRLAIHKSITESPTVYFYLLVIAVFGFTLDGSLRWLQRKLFPWYYSE
jgi:NitT/TauT family transport system permease protein